MLRSSLPHLPVGLRNRGSNVCFLNAVLQGLASVHRFQSYVARESSPLGVHVSNILRAISSPSADGNWPVDASDLLQKACFPQHFRNGRQQDAEELFRFLISALHDTSKRSPASKISYTSLNPFAVIGMDVVMKKRHFRPSLGFDSRDAGRSPFEGLEAQSIRCDSCKNVSSVKYTDFLNLNLFIPPVPVTTLQHCLSHYTQQESVEGYFCDKCHQEVSIQKRTLLGRLPQALCLHLQIAVAGGEYEDSFNPFKVNTFVQFPEILDLAPFHVSGHASFFGGPGNTSTSASASTSSSPSPSPSRYNRQGSGAALGGNPAFFSSSTSLEQERAHSPQLHKVAPYALSAVIVHHGANVGSGHFTCYRRLLRRPDGEFVGSVDDMEEVLEHGRPEVRDDDVWVSVSDETVVPVSKQSVFRSNAYMLFYEAVM